MKKSAIATATAGILRLIIIDEDLCYCSINDFGVRVVLYWCFLQDEINMKDLAGKVAFITGGASGLGLAMAQSFTGVGMKVVIADIEEEALAQTRASFSESNAEIICMQVDVADRDSMAKAREETLGAFGKIHVVCNNAGVARNGNLADMTYQDWDWVMKVNVDGVINGVVTFVNDIKSHGEGGHIVNTASIAGQYGMAGLGVYCAGKFAVVGLSESLRLDLDAHRIGVSVLCPGVVETRIGESERNRPDQYGGSAIPAMTPLNAPPPVDMHIMQAKDIGDMVLHAIQNDRFYILSHEEFQVPVSRRGKELADEFAYWKNYREQNGI